MTTQLPKGSRVTRELTIRPHHASYEGRFLVIRTHTAGQSEPRAYLTIHETDGSAPGLLPGAKRLACWQTKKATQKLEEFKTDGRADVIRDV